MFGETICPQCKKAFRKGQHNARFCTPQCKDDFWNAEKMAVYNERKHQRKHAELERAEDRRQARLEGVNGDVPHKSLSEILGEMPKPEPMKRRAW
jgi:hypothetical protein